jgi:hypothetical protein
MHIYWEYVPTIILADVLFIITFGVIGFVVSRVWPDA